MEIDLRPTAIDMTLCLNKLCVNKCKRYFEYWKRTENQSYIYPGNRYKNGIQQECESRLD